MARTDATGIIYDLLSIARDGATKTGMLYRSDLELPLAERYISFLLDKGLLRQGGFIQRDPLYETTSRGKRILLLLSEFEKGLDMKSTSLDSILEAASSVVGQDGRGGLDYDSREARARIERHTRRSASSSASLEFPPSSPRSPTLPSKGAVEEFRGHPFPVD